MPWIESHSVLLRHRKLGELAADLRIKKVYALGHLHALWHAALEQQEDGDLSSWSDEFIAQSADYDGDAPRFVSLLQQRRWLEPNRLLHDWLDYTGLFLTRKYSTSNRELLVKIWAKHGLDYGANGKRTVSEHKLLAPNQPTNLTNQPNQPHTGGRARGTKRLHNIPSVVEEVIAHGKTLNPPKDEATCREFWAHYEGQARTGPSGDVFWVTSGGVTVTNWRVKLSAFGSARSSAPPKQPAKLLKIRDE